MEKTLFTTIGVAAALAAVAPAAHATQVGPAAPARSR